MATLVAPQDCAGDALTLSQTYQPGVEENYKNELHVVEHAQNDVGELTTQLDAAIDVDDDIKPSDSVSNASKRTSRKRSSAGSHGSRSTVSSTHSARIKAEVEMATLVARQKMLKNKHVLEEQEELLRKRREQLELEMEIAISEAKLNVLRVSGSFCMSSTIQSKADGMNSYLERNKDKTQMLDVEAETFVPRAATQSLKASLSGAEVQPRSHLLDARPKANVLLCPQASLSTQLPQLDPQVMLSSQLPLLHPNPQSEPLQYTSLIQNGSNSDHLVSVLQKQNEITSMLVEQQLMTFLPKRDIQPFDGDPLQYQAFMRAFEHNIEQKTRSPKDRLYFLEQYTRGQPRELVRGCEHMPHEEGYAKAKSLLQEHFGNSLKIASAYMDKVFTWPVVRSEDVKALQAFSIFLRQCSNAMGGVHFSHELDAPTNMQMVVKKLPYKLKERWREIAFNLQEKLSRRVTFCDIVEFIERQVKIASDPLFGDLYDPPAAAGRKEVRPFQSQTYSKVKGSSFATTVATMDKRTRHQDKIESDVKGENTSTVGKSCLFCGAGHTLDLCLLLEGKSHSEKMSFLKENGVCYGCLCIGHRSKDCKKHLFCKVCNLRHPTMLHIRSKETEAGSVQAKMDHLKYKEAGTAGGRALISVQSSGLTGAGERDCTLSILPVQVKSKKGNETLITYAFLDPGSSASFCTEGLMNRMNLNGRKTGILLRTMGQEKVVGSHIVTDLEVAGLGRDCFCALPELFTQKRMPVNQGNIPRHEDLLKWPHLKDVKIDEIDSEVDLLIGTNVPRALEPWEVIRSADGGPYAVKTMLGWTVNGPLRGDCIDDS